MNRKRIALKYRKERCILSDVLPYEVPITFTNRHFYDFLLEHQITYKNGHLSWKRKSEALNLILSIMFGFSKGNIHPDTIDATRDRVTLNKNDGVIPFSYKIRHNQKEFRELTVPHPRSQIEVVDFYNTYKEVILYYSSLSSFSIRHPDKVTKYTYFKDRTHYENLASDSPIVEQHDKEYEHIKSFFVYKNYSNIYKFYEHYHYHRCEKKFNKLLKLDVTKCFDSIYTHSIAWAILGKEVAKENINSENSFSSQFDSLMQRMNHKETNGIIIGPEFSRIFAELILQSIDRDIEIELRNPPLELHNKVHYEIFRYVDDYFIFYNEEHEKDIILETIQHSLKSYKLYLNSGKAVIYDKPIITEISRAKRRIANMLQDKINCKLELIDNEGKNDPPAQKASIYIDSRSLIIQFKTILKECSVSYQDIINYSLSIVENRCDKVVRDFYKAEEKHRLNKELVHGLLSILEFVFFVYSVSPRVNTTIRLCRILRILCSSLKSSDILSELKHLIFKTISDNICLVLKKNKNSRHIQVETLYLLIALSELGKEYWLEEDTLAKYIGVKQHGNDFNCSILNYFSITIVLFYMRDKVRYKTLRESIEQCIISKLNEKKFTRNKDAESAMLLLDVITCPYVTDDTKKTILKSYGVSTRRLQSDIMNFKNKYNSGQLWFTTWLNFDFGRELDAKQGNEVY